MRSFGNDLITADASVVVALLLPKLTNLNVSTQISFDYFFLDRYWLGIGLSIIEKMDELVIPVIFDRKKLYSYTMGNCDLFIRSTEDSKGIRLTSFVRRNRETDVFDIILDRTALTTQVTDQISLLLWCLTSVDG